MSIDENVSNGNWNFVQISVLPFAAAKDLLASNSDNEGKSNDNECISLNLSLKNQWTNGLELRTFLCEEKWPQLKLIEPTIMLALNHKYLMLNESVLLQSGDILALIPPISGG